MTAGLRLNSAAYTNVFLARRHKKESYNLYCELDKGPALGPFECSNSSLHGWFTRGREAVI